MAKEKKAKVSLKETNPYQYHKNWMIAYSCIKWFSIVAPIIGVLTFYIIQANNGAANTNKINLISFPFGVIIAVIASLGIVISASRKAKKETESSINFTGAIACGVTALVLYLCYISVFYLVILFAAEFVGQVIASFCSAGIRNRKDLMKRVETAEINASAITREEKKRSKQEILTKDINPVE